MLRLENVMLTRGFDSFFGETPSYKICRLGLVKVALTQAHHFRRPAYGIMGPASTRQEGRGLKEEGCRQELLR